MLIIHVGANTLDVEYGDDEDEENVEENGKKNHRTKSSNKCAHT